MDLTEAVDVESIPDTQDATSDQAAQSSGKVSSMYAVWDVARTDEMRSNTHRGAWCNPCLKHGVKKDPKGHFLAQIDAILTHVKDCPRCSAAVKQSAAAELRVIRDKKKKGPLAGVKRTASNMSGGSSRRQYWQQQKISAGSCWLHDSWGQTTR